MLTGDAETVSQNQPQRGCYSFAFLGVPPKASAIHADVCFVSGNGMQQDNNNTKEK